MCVMLPSVHMDFALPPPPHPPTLLHKRVCVGQKLGLEAFLLKDHVWQPLFLSVVRRSIQRPSVQPVIYRSAANYSAANSRDITPTAAGTYLSAGVDSRRYSLSSEWSPGYVVLQTCLSQTPGGAWVVPAQTWGTSGEGHFHGKNSFSRKTAEFRGFGRTVKILMALHSMGP